MGVALFIVSEALFFLAIFWAFFHKNSALSPTIELGAQWPPMGIEAVNPFELPLLNTLIIRNLVTVTFAHHSLIQGNRSGALNGLVATVLLALVFTGLDISCMSFFSVGFIVKGSPLSNNYSSATIVQGVEYTVSSFTISDGAFGSCFYFGTGFHGEASILYWHFVDVVWLFLYISIYYWGS
uniref:Cytochrome c oxidase subunit 3 n=1 Tax=Monilinia laxa TaxID=61186 RepID=A0A7L8EYL7_MONLA|nr:cytochrome c oxidase subunit 3 [Monilinia laxa]QOE17486.1 cytochrome c oxidase subunit 3 [Monilinia laxa]